MTDAWTKLCRQMRYCNTITDAWDVAERADVIPINMTEVCFSCEGRCDTNINRNKDKI